MGKEGRQITLATNWLQNNQMCDAPLVPKDKPIELMKKLRDFITLFC